MSTRKVWSEVERNKIPHHVKPIGLKWIFNIKSNGNYKSRIVALGCHHHDGVDYYLSHAPVICEVSMRLFLLTYLKNPTWIIKQIDIEAAFLEGELNDTIYVKLPEGLDIITKRNFKWGLLNKSIYGLVQAARQFHIRLKTYLINNMKLI